jgi:cytoskeletal protein RodZ
VVTAARREMGETLRRQRERRGVPVEVIAKRTNVSSSLFVALERGDCSRWPAGIYARAYLRDYADVVDLDPEDVLARVAQVYPELVWPGAPPDVSASLATAGTLRITFEPEEHEGLRVVFGRLRGLAIELLIVLTLAAGAALLGVSFWMTLAVLLVTSRALGALTGSSAWPTALAKRLRARSAPPEDVPAPHAPPPGAREAAV